MRNMLELICRRFPVIVWMALVVFLVIAAFTYTATPIYTSEARITIPPGQESTLPTTALTSPLFVSITRAEQIQTQIEILQSRNLVEKTIDELPDALFEPEDNPEEESLAARLRETVGGVVRAVRDEVRNLMEKAKISPAMSEREAFVLSCASRLDVRRRRETDVIGLSFTDASPQVAQVFLNKFLEIYVREKATGDSSVTVPFFAEQEQKLRDDLVHARKTLDDFRREWGILNLIAQRDSLLAEDGRILTGINQADAELVQIKVALTAFQESHEAPESVLPDRVREEAGMAETLRNLATLRSRESRLWTEVGDQHPDIINIRTEIARLRAHIQSESQKTLGARANTLASLLAELRTQRENIHNRILTLEARSREMLTLETDVNVLETALGQYAERRETSRMSAAIEAEQINAINVIEPPNLAYKPSSPIVVLNLAFGLFFGVMLGLAYVFFRNRFSSTIYTLEDLNGALARGESDAGTPVAQLPDMDFPQAGGLVRRLFPVRRLIRKSRALPDAIVRKVPENTMAMMGRKFFYPDNHQHIPRSLILTGTGNRVGSTTCAKLLAEHLRKTYACRVLFVEMRFGRPKDRNPVQNGRDFASWLRGGALPEAQEEIATVEASPVSVSGDSTRIILRNGNSPVDVLPAGTLDDSAQSAIFALTREKLDKLRDGYDLMIFDAEPIIRSSIALHIAGLAEDVILVVRSEATRREVLHSTRNALEEIGGRLTGAICNFRRFYIPNWVYRLMQ